MAQLDKRFSIVLRSVSFRGYVYVHWMLLLLRFLISFFSIIFLLISGHGETSWCFSQVKGALNDDITDADVISCVEFNHDGDLLATGDKGGRVVIFQVSSINLCVNCITFSYISREIPHQRHRIHGAASLMSTARSNRTSLNSTT